MTAPIRSNCPECDREYCAICLKDEPGYNADGDCIGDPPRMVDASSWARILPQNANLRRLPKDDTPRTPASRAPCANGCILIPRWACLMPTGKCDCRINPHPRCASPSMISNITALLGTGFVELDYGKPQPK